MIATSMGTEWYILLAGARKSKDFCEQEEEKAGGKRDCQGGILRWETEELFLKKVFRAVGIQTDLFKLRGQEFADSGGHSWRVWDEAGVVEWGTEVGDWDSLEILWSAKVHNNI